MERDKKIKSVLGWKCRLIDGIFFYNCSGSLIYSSFFSGLISWCYSLTAIPCSASQRRFFKRRNIISSVYPLSLSEPVPQPILSAECINKTLYVKCTVKKTEDQVFTIELTQDKINKSQTNVTEVEFTTRHSGRYRCIVKNQVSKKTTEKEIKCPGKRSTFTRISWGSATALHMVVSICGADLEARSSCGSLYAVLRVYCWCWVFIAHSSLWEAENIFPLFLYFYPFSISVRQHKTTKRVSYHNRN